ncbi:MAG: sugar transferase [Gammaproteobacteria bacterium]|nr:sugar transferase [Gammaproteobacteria bacterium]
MIKRLFDIFASLLGLLAASPLLLPVIFLVWKQDKKNPFYVATRMGKYETPFNMIKLRSMVVDADKTGVDSTSSNDMRITPIGHFIRQYKLDELTQLWNVLWGDMSLVGPRPNVKNETDLYTDTEKKLLNIRPGITDFSSIVFSDEGEILEGRDDPDLAYNRLIRPWKSRLGLIYMENRSTLLDLKLIFYTVIAIISRPKALNWVTMQLTKMKVEAGVVTISKREITLYPFPPPGTNEIVKGRL